MKRLDVELKIAQSANEEAQRRAEELVIGLGKESAAHIASYEGEVRSLKESNQQIVNELNVEVSFTLPLITAP